MARIRSVHPDICESQTLADMDDADAERTFVRLWTVCDDEGRAKADTRLLKSKLFPLHDRITSDDVRRDIDLLAKFDLVVLYAVRGVEYLYVPRKSWDKFQHPNRPTPSKLPAPPVEDERFHGPLSEESLRNQDHPGTSRAVVVVGEGVVDGDGGGEAPAATTPLGFASQLVENWRTATNPPRTVRDRNRAIGLVQQFIDAGHSQPILEAAMLESPALSIDALNIAIAKALKAAPAPERTKRVVVQTPCPDCRELPGLVFVAGASIAQPCPTCDGSGFVS